MTSFVTKTAVASLLAFTLETTANAAFTLNWSTAVNHTSTTTNQLRSVDVTPNGTSVYIGYIQTSGNREVDRYNTGGSLPFGAPANTFVSGGNQPKAIATDDRGNVFIANRGSGATSSTISARNATLNLLSSTTPATMPVIGGLTVHKSGATYYAYATYEGSGLIERYDVTNPNAMFLDTTFGTAGTFTVPGGGNLRGIEVAADGTIYVAQRDAGTVFKISPNLATTTSVALPRAMDLAMFGSNLFVTSYNGTSSMIRVLDLATLATVQDITIATLDGNPYSRGASEGWGGIDIDAGGRIWLADQHYGSLGGTQDRLLVSSSLPEPATILVGVIIAAMGPFAVRRMKVLAANG